MERKMVESLKLSGEDASYFANCLFSPSKEWIDRCKKNNDLIRESFQCKEIEDGFEVEVDGLDLSFIDDVQMDNDEIVKNEGFEYSFNDSILFGQLQMALDKFINSDNNDLSPLAA